MKSFALKVGVALAFTAARFEAVAATPTPIVLLATQDLQTQDFDPSVAVKAVQPGYTGGLSIVLLWNVIEPTRGNFNFTTLDTLLSKTVTNSAGANINLAITVVAGSYVPTWVYDPPYGVKIVKVTIAPDSGGNSQCVANTAYPIVWDSNYSQAYIDMMSAVATHLKTQQASNAYSRVLVVKNGSIGLHSGEFALPVSASCQGAFAGNNSAWLAKGFNDTLLEGAWQDIESKIAPLFPNAILAQGVLATPGAEMPAKDGVEDSDTTFPNKILDDGRLTYKGRFVAQSNDISNFCDTPPATDGCPVSQTIETAKQSGSNVAFQVNAWCGSCGSGCDNLNPEQSTLCTSDEYSRIFNYTQTDRAKWIEVHTSDPVPPATASTCQPKSCSSGN